MRDVNKASAIHEEQHLRRRAAMLLRNTLDDIVVEQQRVSLNYFALKPPEALPRHRAGATPTATAQQGSCRPCYSHRVLFGQPSDFVDDDDPLFRRWSLSGTRLGQA